ncbi:DoxX family protein [Qipengyuania sp. 1NDW9]|uniref:DoxX family protein n=1 Tax=Qipengyuania aquimaris TaxID=255984 RepID=A0A9Q3RYK2_9SPHN|nr:MULTISPECIES: DoxX family protein [Qipengyuania]MBX7494033.1 DoxX family protein [Qipengyuania xiapuensis]MBY6216777.1 DoxX family protein [Qipengyuania aquimaris]
MQNVLTPYDRLTAWLSSRLPEGLALLITRVALAGIFWRSGRTKVEEGTALSINETTYFLFEYEYTGLPLPVDLAVPLATYAEHLFPILLVLGLFTRFAALSLLLMTLVIQFFVYPEAWWATHILWVAMAAILVSRGGGLFSADRLLASRRAR